MGYALVTMNQTLYGKYQANVICFDNVQEETSWLQEFADEIRSLANEHWDGQMVTNWYLLNISVSFIEGDHIAYSVDVDFTEGDLQGNELGDGMPGGSSLLVSTAYVGEKPNRGRVYFSGLSEQKQSDGAWDANARQGLKDLVEAWSTGLTIQGITASMQIARRPGDTFPSYEFNPVQTVSTTVSTRSQRRRNGES